MKLGRKVVVAMVLSLLGGVLSAGGPVAAQAAGTVNFLSSQAELEVFADDGEDEFDLETASDSGWLTFNQDLSVDENNSNTGGSAAADLNQDTTLLGQSTDLTGISSQGTTRSSVGQGSTVVNLAASTDALMEVGFEVVGEPVGVKVTGAMAVISDDAEDACSFIRFSIDPGFSLFQSLNSCSGGSDDVVLEDTGVLEPGSYAFTFDYDSNAERSSAGAESAEVTWDIAIEFLPCTIIGTDGPDELTGTAQDDVVCGLGDADELEGAGGNDIVLGGDGDDHLMGGEGADILQGGNERDLIEGGAGTDLIEGGAGADGDPQSLDFGLFGGDDNDLIRGGPGADFIAGDGSPGQLSCSVCGNDILDGGEGGDEITEAADSSGTNLIDGGSGDDTITGGQGRDLIFAADGSDAIFGEGGHDEIGAGDDADLRVFGGPGDDLIEGGAGSDRLRGERGSDKLRGQGGNDLLVGHTRKDVLIGAGGRDTLIANDGVRDVVKGGPARDEAKVDDVDEVTGVETLL